MAEELHDEVVAGAVVGCDHARSVSRLSDVPRPALVVATIVFVLAVWLVGSAVTGYSLEKMAYLTPIAVVAVGATIGLVVLWVKIVVDSLHRRRGET
jgi:hypothetical protein